MKRILLLAAGTLVLAGLLAGCADNADESTANDVGANNDCDDRNLADDDVLADDDGTTLGECEENAPDQ